MAEQREVPFVDSLITCVSHLANFESAVIAALDFNLPQLLWNLAIAEDALKILGGFAAGVGAVEVGDHFFTEFHLCVHRMQLAAGDFAF